MESTTERLTLEREISIAASPETIWAFLVEPEKMRRWMGTGATLDLRPGGAYRIDVIPGHVASGEYVEVDPPRRLVYTWGWEPGDEGPNPVPPGSSTVELELVPDGVQTIVRVLHRDLPSQESVESHGQGWDHYYGRLAAAATGADPGADPWVANIG